MLSFTHALIFVVVLLGTLVQSAPIPVPDDVHARHWDEVNTDTYSYAPYSAAPAPYRSSESDSAPVTYSSGSDSNSSDWKQKMLVLVNAVRSKQGLNPLQLHDGLNQMAQEHSDYQASTKTMTHHDPRGTLGQRCTRAGINWRGAAENVAWNYKYYSTAMAGWINSPGHYANLVGDYTHVGFGETDLYWTQNFAKIA